ncbi:ketopantoate reductase PanE/ApbA-domain-containing protein [Kockovaella imperatae]|uniref:Ketopantoate reductase PanE/ApbA-domain-containing protein n=1 Tax=Kockovaella imperatae TaxID=4999 RepID=A0A1Y1UD54_9TREE|nr:ketopantoate reductase PanE/ApbA-domain-containing protein [Kockovaella imperatae]ORX35942.1 ketopantoate reductase PanE/ApbA-domain-containing protein [Kockovaella imperatae]
MTRITTVGGSGRPVNILLVGLGSIGSVYAFLLERSGRAKVTAIARSNYKLYAEHGITLKTIHGTFENWKPYRVFRSQEEALSGNVYYDYCLNCTKYLPDVITTPKLLAPAIASRKIGAWVLIQNGLGVEEELYQAVKDQDTPLISGVAWIGIMTSPDGRVVTWASKDTLVLGTYPPLRPPKESQDRQFTSEELSTRDDFAEIVRSGGGDVHTEDRITSIRYAKNVINCAWSTMEGLMRTTPHTLEDLDESHREPLKQFIREIVTTGFKSGLLDEDQLLYPDRSTTGTAEQLAARVWSSIYEASCQKYHVGAAPHRMSLLVDLEMGRPFEVEAIEGSVLKLAKEYGVSTPLLAYSYALLKGSQLETLRKLDGRGAKQ